MFRPKLFDAWRNSDRATFLADLAAGVVALLLAIGFCIGLERANEARQAAVGGSKEL
jgi:hypothetical protein